MQPFIDQLETPCIVIDLKKVRKNLELTQAVRFFS